MARERIQAWLVALAATAAPASAQPAAGAALTVESRTLRYADARMPERDSDHRYPAPESIVMPWVRGGRPGVADRINELVFLRVLHHPAPRTPGLNFTLSTIEPLDGFSEIHFAVGRNDARVFSLAMDMEQCGQHCTLVGETLLFDARSGRRLLLADLVTPAGRATLVERRNRVAIDAYRQALDELPPNPDMTDVDTEQSSPPPSPAPASKYDADMPSDEEQRNYFTGCLSMWEQGTQIALTFDLPPTGGLKLDMVGCGGSPRQRSMDLGPSELSIPPAELAPLLTDYGRWIVLGEGAGAAPSAVLGQVMHGHVGTAAITMYLDAPATDSVLGTYAYDRIGRPIEVSGGLKDDTWRLEEGDGKDFTLHRAGAALEGTWTGGGKHLPVRLQ